MTKICEKKKKKSAIFSHNVSVLCVATRAFHSYVVDRFDGVSGVGPFLASRLHFYFRFSLSLFSRSFLFFAPPPLASISRALSLSLWGVKHYTKYPTQQEFFQIARTPTIAPPTID
jgi:hypothetical protein